MARKNRVWYPGAIYHVMNRGNRKALIFKEKGDYQHFLEQVMHAKKHYPFKVHAICLMPNHFHIVVETEMTDLGKIMSKILTSYAMFFNKKYSLVGHLFGGRYKASLIEDAAYFLEVNRYIHLNPVKAMMVKSPADYEYSSYPLFIYDEEERSRDRVARILEKIIDTSRVLGAFNNDRERYRAFVEGNLSHEEHEQKIMKDMNEDEMWLP